MRQGRRLIERHRGGDRQERLFWRRHVLREGRLTEVEQVAEGTVSGFEPRDVRADGLDDAGDIQPQPGTSGPADAEEEPRKLPAWIEAVEVGPVHRRGVNADEHLALFRARAVDLADFDHARRSVSVAGGGLHWLGVRGSRTTMAVSPDR